MKNSKQLCIRIMLSVLCVSSMVSGTVQAESAASPPLPVLIIELQTASIASGNDEFVEIYNPNATAIDMAGWQLQYRASTKTGATPKDWQQMVNTLVCTESATCDFTIKAYGRRTLASTSLARTGDILLLKDGMATESGQVRMLDSMGNVQDMLGYGTAAVAEGGKPAPKLVAGKSLKRQVTEDGHFIDTNINADDFIGGCTPTPHDAASIMASSCSGKIAHDPSDEDDADTDTTTPAPDADEDTETSTPGEIASPVTLLITEILPNPASPQQDDTDEFIELYNPHDTVVSTAGYTLQAGSDYKYKFSLPALNIPPHGYLVVPASQSHLVLSNSGGVVRLTYSTRNTVVDETQPYAEAKEGHAWMRDETGWHWTTQPTPGVANIRSIPPVATSAPVATKQKIAKASTATAKTVKPKVLAVPKSTKKSQVVAATPKEPVSVATTSGNPHLWLLIPIGLIMVGYALYEYRDNIARLVERLRVKNTRPKATSSL